MSTHEAMNLDEFNYRKPPTKFTLKSSIVDAKKKTVSVQLKEEQETRDYVKNISGNKIESETPKEEKNELLYR